MPAPPDPSSPSDDAEIEARFIAAESHLRVKMSQSAMVATLVPESDPDWKIMLETGAAIWLDKPLIVIATHDRDIPERLRRAADHIIVADPTTPVGRNAIERTLARLSEQIAEPDA